jgi:Zn-dependent protease with chaperone function
MLWASYLLAALAILLAWPAPVLLSTAQWPARSPFVAMVLWQAIALAGGLSMIGAMLVWGLDPLGGNLVAALHELGVILIHNGPADRLGLLHVFALSAASLLGAHLVFTLLLTYARIEGQRSRHRDMLNLLSSPAPGAASTVVISHPIPVAYCLPGGARSVTVLSEGLLEMLDPQELLAVLSHERAHLMQRHHLLLWAFAAWRAALPWLPTSRLAQGAVNQLIEMLADDQALKKVEPAALARAIAVVASGRPDPGAAGAGIEDLSVPADGAEPDARTAARRVERLLEPRQPLTSAGAAAAVAGSALLLVVPTTLLVVPGLFR